MRVEFLCWVESIELVQNIITQQHKRKKRDFVSELKQDPNLTKNINFTDKYTLFLNRNVKTHN